MIDWIGVVLGGLGLGLGLDLGPSREIQQLPAKPSKSLEISDGPGWFGLVLVIPAVVLLLLDSKWTPCFVLLDSCSGCRKLSIPQAIYCSWSRGSAELR